MVTEKKISDNVYMLRDSAGCYSHLVLGNDRALVFDTGAGVDDMYEAVRKITGLPLVVLNSHGHFDHVGGNYQFERVYLHSGDFCILQEYDRQILRKWVGEMVQDAADVKVEQKTSDAVDDAGDFGNWESTVPLDFETFDLGDMSCRIISLPGHTKGSVGVWIPNLRLLLSGDALTPVMCLMFQNHMSAKEQYATLKAVQNLDFDGYLSAHHEQLFEKAIVERMIRCLENSENGRWYEYQYPYPPYSKGKMYVDSLEEEPVALIV